MPTTNDGYYLTIEKASEYFKVSTRTIRRRIKNKELKGTKKNGKLMVFIDTKGQYTFDDYTTKKATDKETITKEIKHSKNGKFEPIEGKDNELLQVVIKQLEIKDKQLEKQGEQIIQLTERIKEINYIIASVQKALPNPEQEKKEQEKELLPTLIFLGITFLIVGGVFYLIMSG